MLPAMRPITLTRRATSSQRKQRRQVWVDAMVSDKILLPAVPSPCLVFVPFAQRNQYPPLHSRRKRPSYFRTLALT